MSELAGDLRAAKALIDTPEKWCDVGGVVAAIGLAVANKPRRLAAIHALLSVGIIGSEPHPLLMAVFDRAIAKAEGR